MTILKVLPNIQSSYEKIKQLFLITMAVVIAICLTVCITVPYWAYHYAISRDGKIYVMLPEGQTFSAKAENAKINRPVQARFQVKRFHELFFGLDPSKEAIENSIKKALEFSDESPATIYNDLSEQGYYGRIISGNVSQEVVTDSIKLNFSANPEKIQALFYGRQIITRASSTTMRLLQSKCSLRQVAMTDSNPLGFLIQEFRVTLNEDIE